MTCHITNQIDSHVAAQDAADEKYEMIDEKSDAMIDDWIDNESALNIVGHDKPISIMDFLDYHAPEKLYEAIKDLAKEELVKQMNEHFDEYFPRE